MDRKQRVAQLNAFVEQVVKSDFLSATTPGAQTDSVVVNYSNDIETARSLMRLWGTYPEQRPKLSPYIDYEPLGITTILHGGPRPSQSYLPDNRYLLLPLYMLKILGIMLVVLIYGPVLVIIGVFQRSAAAREKADDQLYEAYDDSFRGNRQFSERGIWLDPDEYDWVYFLFDLKADALYEGKELPYANEVDVLCDLICAGYLPVEVTIKPGEKTVITAFYGDFLQMIWWREEPLPPVEEKYVKLKGKA